MAAPISDVEPAFSDALSNMLRTLGSDHNLGSANDAIFKRICALHQLYMNRVSISHARNITNERAERDRLVQQLADADTKLFNFETEFMGLRLKSNVSHPTLPAPKGNPLFEYSKSIRYALSTRARFDTFDLVVGWRPLLLKDCDAAYTAASDPRSFADSRQGVVLCHARLDTNVFQRFIDGFRDDFQEEVHTIAHTAFLSLLSDPKKRTNGKSFETSFNQVLSFVMAAMAQFASNQIAVIDNLMSTLTNHFFGLSFQPDMWVRTADQVPSADEAAKFVFDPSLLSKAELVDLVCSNICSRAAPSRTTPTVVPPSSSSLPSSPTEHILLPASQSPAADAFDVPFRNRQNQLIADDTHKSMSALSTDLVTFLKSQLRDAEYSTFYLSENKLNYTYISALEEQIGQTLCLSSYFAADKAMFSFRICPGEMMVFVSLPLDMTDPLATDRKRMTIVHLLSVQLLAGVAGMCQTAEIIGAVVRMAKDRAWVDMIQCVYEMTDSKQLAYVEFDTFSHPCLDSVCVEASRAADSSSPLPGTINNSQPAQVNSRSSKAASSGKHKKEKKSTISRPSSDDANSADSANDCDAASAFESSKSLDFNDSIDQARPASASAEHYFVSLSRPLRSAELADGDNSAIIRPFAVHLQSSSLDADFNLSNFEPLDLKLMSRSTSEPRSEADSTSSGSSGNESSFTSKITRNSDAAPVENLRNRFAAVAI